MAKHEIIIHENTSATKESAPYLGSYLSKETIKSDEFAAKIAEKCGLPAIQVQAIIAGAFDVIEELEQEGLVRIHIDGFTVCGIITGSFPTADAAFNPEKNTLQLALRLDESIRNELAAVVPSIVTDSSVTRLRVDNVMDLEAPRPYNVIHGKHVFRVAGFNMVLTDEGAGVALVDSRGIEYDLVIDEVVSKQLFKAWVYRVRNGMSRQGKRYTVVTVRDATGYADLYFFLSQRFVAQKLKPDMQILAVGRVKQGRTAKAVGEVNIQILQEDGEESTPGILPVYALNAALTQKQLRAWMKIALELAADKLPESLPRELVESQGLPDRYTAIKNIHFPASWEELRRAQQRFIFEELFVLQCGLLAYRKNNKNAREGYAHGADGERLAEVRRHLPFKLTEALEQACKALGDSARICRMNTPCTAFCRETWAAARPSSAPWRSLRLRRTAIRAALWRPRKSSPSSIM